MSEKVIEITKPKKNIIDLDHDLTIKNKYKIMRWKLFRILKDLVVRDFDKFLEEATEDFELIDYLMMKGSGYGILYDEKKEELKYNLKESRIWKRMLGEMDNEIENWNNEYNKWLEENSRDIIE